MEYFGRFIRLISREGGDILSKIIFGRQAHGNYAVSFLLLGGDAYMS